MSAPALVSIVTPVYNMARYVRETVESVLFQDYPHIQYIVMDGGSTDGTVDILREYQGRLQYFTGRDQGAADAINRGFQRAAGAVLAWIDADDTYLPGAVAAAMRSLSEPPASSPPAATAVGPTNPATNWENTPPRPRTWNACGRIAVYASRPVFPPRRL